MQKGTAQIEAECRSRVVDVGQPEIISQHRNRFPPDHRLLNNNLGALIKDQNYRDRPEYLHYAPVACLDLQSMH